MLPEGTVGKITAYLPGHGSRGTVRADKSRAAVADLLLQASHRSDDERYAEIHGNGADSALGGAPVRKDDKVGGRKILPDFSVGDEIGENVNVLLRGRRLDLRRVFFEGTVGFSGYDKLETVIKEIERVKEDVQALVIPYQAEEQEGLPVRVQAEIPAAGLYVKRLAELVGQRMRQDDMRLGW